MKILDGRKHLNLNLFKKVTGALEIWHSGHEYKWEREWTILLTSIFVSSSVWNTQRWLFNGLTH